jgi:excisionase family DNA binding protein
VATPVSPSACAPEVSTSEVVVSAAALEAGLPGTPFLSLREAADWLCVSLSTLKRTIAKGDLATVQVGKRRKLPASYLAAYVAKDILLPDQVVDFTQDDSIAFEYSDSE